MTPEQAKATAVALLCCQKRAQAEDILAPLGRQDLDDVAAALHITTLRGNLARRRETIASNVGAGVDSRVINPGRK